MIQDFYSKPKDFTKIEKPQEIYKNVELENWNTCL